MSRREKLLASIIGPDMDTEKADAGHHDQGYSR